jgi:hypothetical protein
VYSHDGVSISKLLQDEVAKYLGEGVDLAIELDIDS